MKRFKKILAVLNGGAGDPEVERRAVALARANGARLTFCAPRVDYPSAMPKFGRFYRELERLLDSQRASILDNAVEAAQSSGVAAEGRVLDGKAFVSVIQQVLRESHDIVLFPDDEATSIQSTLFGSTATHLLRKCPCPVWVIKASDDSDDERRFRRVLAAVNAVSEDSAEQRLNTKILELATSLAEREGAETHVVHCWSVYGESLLATRGRMEPEELDEYRTQTRRSHEEALDSALHRFTNEGTVVRPHLRKGDPGREIPDLAAELPADVVVMGTVARTGINGVFIGNTAESVLQRIRCSVLAVKPDGFASPVTVEDTPARS
jgi:nucleotide-binding universal stress UspA family protein